MFMFILIFIFTFISVSVSFHFHFHFHIHSRIHHTIDNDCRDEETKLIVHQYHCALCIVHCALSIVHWNTQDRTRLSIWYQWYFINRSRYQSHSVHSELIPSSFRVHSIHHIISIQSINFLVHSSSHSFTHLSIHPQSSNQSINRSIDQSINQSINPPSCPYSCPSLLPVSSPSMIHIDSFFPSPEKSSSDHQDS
jgi:hypothetical protein